VALGRVRRTRSGGFRLTIPPAERELLRTLPARLREVLEEGDPSSDPALRRLFPSAYLDDPDAAAEFDEVVRGDLVAERRRALETMERTIDARRIGEEELQAWLAAINDLRLVLGVRLNLTEGSGPDDFEGDEAGARAYALYAYLSFLEEDVVTALSGG